MPTASENFLGLGWTLDGCNYPIPPGIGEPAGCVNRGVPTDPSGAAGPNQYVQVVDSGYAVFRKDGTAFIQSPRTLDTLWAGYPTTDGNECSVADPFLQVPNSGVWYYQDNHPLPFVSYDQLAGRWVVVMADVHNSFASTPSGPSYECVAVSQTSDPTGAWWRYDFKYDDTLPDSPRLGIWPDGYYFSYNGYAGSSYTYSGAKICAWNRAAMLAGPDGNAQAEAQQCFNEGTGVLSLAPASVDGPVPPPAGSPEDVLDLGTSTTASAIHLRRFHVDWNNPANSWLGSSSSSTTPISLSVNSFTEACSAGACIPQPSPGNSLQAVSDRLMNRVVYRNFGGHESLLANHSVTAGSSVGVRWYEIRDPNGSPSVYQQGTLAPDSSYRWMGSVAEDQAQDMVAGYSLSSSSTDPSVAWSGRLASDTTGTMPQSEVNLHTGGGVETDTNGGGHLFNYWGYWSDLTLDPSDDCTFWYTNEYYPSNGSSNWDTRIAAVKFPGCAANDFSLSAPDATVVQGSSAPDAIATEQTNGSPEAISLYVQDLPPGVTASFNPSTIATSNSSTLTFNASPTATPGKYTVGVVASAPSATHYATLTLTVNPPSDFSISANPTTVSAVQGSSGHTSINTSVTAGSAQNVALQANGLPTGATASFNPTPVTAGQSSTLTLSADASTPPGTYPVRVNGTEAVSGAQHSTMVSFTVTAPSSSSGSTSGSGGGSTSGSGSTNLTVGLVGAPASTGTGVSDTVTCTGPAGEGCQVTETLTASETVNHGKVVGVSKKRTVLVGQRRVAITTGHRASVTITLNATGRSLLKHFGRLPVELTINLIRNGQAVTATTRKLTIRPTKKRHRSRDVRAQSLLAATVSQSATLMFAA